MRAFALITTRVLIAAALGCAAPVAALAQSASLTVNFEIPGISNLGMNGPHELIVNTAVAGSPNATPATASAQYTLESNLVGCRLVASIDANMPAGTSLSASVEAPGGSGTTAGTKLLSTVAVDVVTGVGVVDTAAGSPPAINYTVTSAATTPPMTFSRVVTFTLVSS